eukprot:365947-Chlamydomonas_euryale.AAC.4
MQSSSLQTRHCMAEAQIPGSKASSAPCGRSGLDMDSGYFSLDDCTQKPAMLSGLFALIRARLLRCSQSPHAWILLLPAWPCSAFLARCWPPLWRPRLRGVGFSKQSVDRLCHNVPRTLAKMPDGSVVWHLLNAEGPVGLDRAVGRRRSMWRAGAVGAVCAVNSSRLAGWGWYGVAQDRARWRSLCDSAQPAR